jgi:hypothetical protein
MVRRYLRIKDQLESIDSLESFWLTPKQNKLLKEAHEHFRVFHCITSDLQLRECDLLYCRKQFDTLLEDEDYKCMAHYIGRSAGIIASPSFESGVLKLMAGERLTEAEAAACYKLKVSAAADDSADDDSDDESTAAPTLLEKLQENRKYKKQRLDEKGTTKVVSESKDFIDPTNLIGATSNCCERLFSEAKYIMVPHRRAMSPVLFEALLYLKKNMRLWDAYVVSKAMRLKEEEIRGLARDDEVFYEEEE